MPVDVKYICDGAGVIHSYTADVSFEDLYYAIDRTYESVDTIKKIQFILFNFLETTSTTVSPEEFRILINKDRDAAKINSKIVVAVVGPTDLIFGLSRMYEMLADELPWKQSTFRTLSEAKSWIKQKTGLEVF